MRKLTEKQVGKKIIISELSKTDAHYSTAKRWIYGKVFLVEKVLTTANLAEIKGKNLTKIILNSLQYKLAKPKK